MVLPLVVQAPPFENHWAKCFLLFSATVHCYASWLLAAVFLAILLTWPSSSTSYHSKDTTPIQKIKHSLYTSFSLPSRSIRLWVSPHFPLARSFKQLISIPLLQPGLHPSSSTYWLRDLGPGGAQSSCVKNEWVFPTSRTSLVVSWLEQRRVDYCLPTETITADFLIRVVLAYFVLMRIIVCFDWVACIPVIFAAQ